MPYDPTKPYNAQIEAMMRKTWDTPYVLVAPNGIITMRDSIAEMFATSCMFQADHTDGIGTKGFYHWKCRTFREAVIDAMAMNLNDLAMVRAIPYKIQNHLILPTDDRKALFEIMERLVEECYRRDIAITGGETSMQYNLDGMELSITMSGLIRADDLSKENRCRENDILLGFRSNGLHSNGFTKVREVLGEDEKYFPEITTCTAHYNSTLKLIADKIPIHGMQHITGGAFTKLKRILGDNDALISTNHKLEPHPIFRQLHSFGISDEEMYKTFNCGIGFVISVPQDADLSWALGQYGVDVIGRVVKGSGHVCIQSYFTGNSVTF